MIILDTNVLSEFMRPNPSDQVRRWAGTVREPLFTTAMCQAEIFFGLAIMSTGRRQADLVREAEGMFAQDFRGRILSFDAAAARAFADIAAGRRRVGRPIAIVDAQIAAIAQTLDATVATRNVADFEQCGVAIINPWDT